MFTEKYQALKSLECLKYRRERTVFVGDHEDAERCKELKEKKITRYWPSQWHQRHPEGYIQFAGGRGWDGSKLFDVKSRTINGRATYIFEDSERIRLLSRRLEVLNLLREYARQHQADDLLSYFELVVLKVDPTVRSWRSDEYLRSKIWKFLPVLGLADLEALVDAAKPRLAETVRERIA